ncbi:hypothetical protein ACWOC1_05340 [Enterococcus quebecensis]|uniref:Uncharacterized protein n=1 Tax=Enterococcus quebecensis TaxID=903983 RepID=A0A1E5GUC4_9ENTE|nr:hypothetical protein [Enterococcus quebecensis]OEG16272.1 hypothetical protein BCR23_05125 [Enterococcus quebecensis]OJG74454.1 hypothetical protein RV12_GL002511 [Enterococcus quebecensis]
MGKDSKMWNQINKNSEDINEILKQLATENCKKKDEKIEKVSWFTKHKDKISGFGTILGSILTLVTLAFVSYKQKEISQNNLKLSENVAELNKANLPLQYKISYVDLKNVNTEFKVTEDKFPVDSIHTNYELNLSGEIRLDYKILQGAINTIYLVDLHIDKKLTIDDFVFQGDKANLKLKIEGSDYFKIKKAPFLVVTVDNNNTVSITYVMPVIETVIKQVKSKNDPDLIRPILQPTEHSVLFITEKEIYSPKQVDDKISDLKNHYKEKYNGKEIDDYFIENQSSLKEKFKEVRNAYLNREK